MKRERGIDKKCSNLTLEKRERRDREKKDTGKNKFVEKMMLEYVALQYISFYRFLLVE
jgi:hypothetical protein